MKNLLRSTLLLLATSASLFAQVPASKHVYLVALENRSYEHLVGSSSMPYLNSLFTKGTLATQFYANRHTSITDYFLVTSGQFPTTNDSTSSIYNIDNMARRLMTMGHTYKVYAQTLPSVGYSGLTSGAYMKRHTALPYYTDMGNSTTEMRNLVPVGQLLTDIQNGALPNFAVISPDANHDLHNCPSGLSACEQLADSFLKSYVAPLLASPAFQAGGDGILILWSDEADLSTDNRCSSTVSSGCGGRVMVAMVGPKVRAGYKSTVTYHHQNVLRTMLWAFGTTSNFPGLANTASVMGDFFSSSGVPSTGTAAVTISSPTQGSTVGSSVHVVATTTQTNVTASKVYVDGVAKYSTSSGSVNTYLTLSSGSHKITVSNWNTSGVVTKASVTFTVN